MKPTYIIVHHTGGTALDPRADTSSHTFETINEWHRNQFNFKSSLGFYCGYQYFIDKNGKITQARKDTEEGAHTLGRNKDSIGICLAGNFTVALPTKSQETALQGLLKQKVEEYSIKLTNVVPHRFFAKYKDCYGSRLPDDWARKLVSLPSQKDIINQLYTTLGNHLKKEDFKQARDTTSYLFNELTKI